MVAASIGAWLASTLFYVGHAGARLHRAGKSVKQLAYLRKKYSVALRGLSQHAIFSALRNVDKHSDLA